MCHPPRPTAPPDRPPASHRRPLRPRHLDAVSPPTCSPAHAGGLVGPLLTWNSTAAQGQRGSHVAVHLRGHERRCVHGCGRHDCGRQARPLARGWGDGWGVGERQRGQERWQREQHEAGPAATVVCSAKQTSWPTNCQPSELLPPHPPHLLTRPSTPRPLPPPLLPSPALAARHLACTACLMATTARMQQSTAPKCSMRRCCGTCGRV